LEQLIELLVLLGGTLLLATFFGTYLARLISYENRPIEKTLAIVENRFYRLIGIDVSKQMTWKEYFLALFVTDMVVAVIVISILTFQNYLPSNTPVEGFSIDLAVHTAISFVTDTNLQHYAGDQQLSVLSQMAAITFTMFVAPPKPTPNKEISKPKLEKNPLFPSSIMPPSNHDNNFEKYISKFIDIHIPKIFK